MMADNVGCLNHTASSTQLADNIPQLEFKAPMIRTPLGEDDPEVWSFTCPECPGEQFLPSDSAGYFTHVWPERCTSCARERQRMRRMMNYKDLVKREHDLIAKPYVGFLTLNLRGYQDSYFRSASPSVLEERILEARRELYSRWTPFWRNYLKKNCAGAIRFFEWTQDVSIAQDHLDDSDPTTVDYKIHPHLHVIILQDKPIEITELRAAAVKGVTKIVDGVKTHTPGFGDQIDMQWKKDASTLGSVSYCLAYVKKDLQASGRNRQAYGCFHGSSSRTRAR